MLIFDPPHKKHFAHFVIHNLKLESALTNWRNTAELVHHSYYDRALMVGGTTLKRFSWKTLKRLEETPEHEVC